MGFLVTWKPWQRTAAWKHFSASPSFRDRPDRTCRGQQIWTFFSTSLSEQFTSLPHMEGISVTQRAIHFSKDSESWLSELCLHWETTQKSLISAAPSAIRYCRISVSVWRTCDRSLQRADSSNTCRTWITFCGRRGHKRRCIWNWSFWESVFQQTREFADSSLLAVRRSFDRSFASGTRAVCLFEWIERGENTFRCRTSSELLCICRIRTTSRCNWIFSDSHEGSEFGSCKTFDWYLLSISGTDARFMSTFIIQYRTCSLFINFYLFLSQKFWGILLNRKEIYYSPYYLKIDLHVFCNLWYYLILEK